jgi:hypothetical protein
MKDNKTKTSYGFQRKNEVLPLSLKNRCFRMNLDGVYLDLFLNNGICGTKSSMPENNIQRTMTMVIDVQSRTLATTNCCIFEKKH